MVVKHQIYWTILAVATLGLLLTANGMAGEKRLFPVTLHVKTVFSPFLTGDAGTGAGAPAFTDIFRSGYGGRLEGEYHFSDKELFIAGLGLEKYSGKPFQSLKFSDMTLIPFYGGYQRLFPAVLGIRPHAGLTVGAAHLSSVAVSWSSFSRPYWKAAWVLTGDFGVGLDLDREPWHLSVDVRLRYTGAPDAVLGSARAQDFWSVPLTVGIRYSF